MGEIVIICGGRHFAAVPKDTPREQMEAAMQLAGAQRRMMYAALDEQHAEAEISAVIEGGMSGADDVARDWAGDRRRGHLRMEADWDKYGRAAGPRRNAAMLREHPVTRVICAPGGDGTADMRTRALDAGVAVTDLVLIGDRLERRDACVDQPSLF